MALFMHKTPLNQGFQSIVIFSSKVIKWYLISKYSVVCCQLWKEAFRHRFQASFNQWEVSADGKDFKGWQVSADVFQLIAMGDSIR